MRSWHFPLVKEIADMLKEKINNIAEIDVQPLRQKLLAKKQLPVILQSDNQRLLKLMQAGYHKIIYRHWRDLWKAEAFREAVWH